MASSSTPSLPVGFTTIRQLSNQRPTGVLRLRSRSHTDLDVYFLEGQVISACGLADDWLFGRLLVQSGSIAADALERLLDAFPDLPLNDALLHSGALAMHEVQAHQEAVFRENFALACVTPWEMADFAPEDVVFPPNMQLGVDTEGFLDELVEWHGRVAGLLLRLRHGDVQLAIVGGAEMPSGHAAALLDRVGPTPRLSELMARSPWPPYRTLGAAAELLAGGALVIERRAEDRVPGSLTDELEAIAAVSEDPEERLDTVGLEPFDSADADSDDILPADLASVTVQTDAHAALIDLDSEDGEVDDEIDYEHVDAGGHAQVYEVLDKVDLSHVDTFPAEIQDVGLPDADEPVQIVSAASTLELPGDDIEEISGAFGMPADEDSEYGEETPSSEDASVYEYDVEDSSADLDDAADLRRLAAVQEPPVHLSGSEESLELLVDDAGGASAAPAATDRAAADGAAASRPDLLADAPYPSAKMTAFAHRVAVFNRIFEVVFATFAEALGEQATRERFGRLLRDDSLQYPELFTGLHVARDGTLEARGLIDNLARSHPLDSDAYLHQGLYELIYIHLYDAKDLLSPDAERAMMDRIASFEEELHRN